MVVEQLRAEYDDLPTQKAEISEKSVTEKTGLAPEQRKRRVQELLDAGLDQGEDTVDDDHE